MIINKENIICGLLNLLPIKQHAVTAYVESTAFIRLHERHNYIGLFNLQCLFTAG